MKENIFKLSIVNCQLSIITAALLLFTACSGEESGTGAPETEANITVETRGLATGTTYPFTFNMGNENKNYNLISYGNPTFAPASEADRTYIAPGTTTLPVYAWATVRYNLENGNAVFMPVLHANPITPVTWSTDAQPTINIALTPATTNIQLVVKDDKGQTITPTNATLHGIATPKVENYSFVWNETTLPPTLESVEGSNTLSLATNGTHTQAIPGTVGSGKHLLTIEMTDGTQHAIIANRPYTFLPAYEYTINVTINTQGKAEITNINMVDMIEGGIIGIGSHIISTEADLIAFREAVNAGNTTLNAIQVANITLTKEWTPIGYSNNEYAGTYNGGGYTITGLTIKGNLVDFKGFFGFASNATLTGIHLKNPNIEGDCTGALAGIYSGTITQCSVEGGTVKGLFYAGGLVGWNNGTIAACYATTTVNGEKIIGGLVGENYGTIAFCYATGNVSSASGTSNITGSLVGYNYRTNVISSYATGSVNGFSKGSTVGKNEYNGTIESCPKYNDDLASIVRTYTGPAILGFTANIWTDDEYPKLKWQK